MPDGAHGRVARILVAIAASSSLVLGLGTGVFAVRWYDLRTQGTKEFPPVPPPTSAGPTRLLTGPCAVRTCNYLLIGSDSREGLTPEEQEKYGTEGDVGGDERADTVMLVHSNPDRSKAVILSFPRDLWVRIPDVGWDKLNSAFTGGIDGDGPQQVARTIANLTGLQIDHFLYVDFNGFKSAVDELGGVKFCPPSYLANADGRIVDELADLDIAPGCQHMDGVTALAFVRARHLPCDNIPDFSRIGRQQQFFRALITQMLRPSQVWRAPGLVEPVLSAMRRDADFLPGDLVAMVGDLRGFSTGAADFRAVPGVGGMEGDISVVRVDPSAEALFRAIRDGEPLPAVGKALLGTPISPANVPVAVFDTASQGAAAETETFLGNAGFDVSPGIRGVAELPKGAPKGPVIVYGPGHDGEATVLASYLPGVKIVEVRALEGVPVAVVVPAGFAPQETPPPAEPAACPPT